MAAVARALERRELTSAAVTDECLAAIDARDGAINAFVTVLPDQAREEARRADAEIAAGRYRGPLHGVPVALKDIIDMSGVATTAASNVRRGHLATRDATVVSRLRAAGAVIVGKNNLHEFAFGTTSEDSAFGAVRHPLDTARSPGGSSGGSAAAVLAGMACAAIGTDTGGSVRIPASVCGLVGLKPTLGEIPTHGVVPLSTTLDHVGPIARSVEDVGLLHDVLRGAPAALRGPAPDARGIRLCAPGGYFTELLDEEVRSTFEQARVRLERAGTAVAAASLPHAALTPAIYLVIQLTEAAAYHTGALERCPQDYSPRVRLRLESGRYILAEDYVRARTGRKVLRAAVDDLLQQCDALLLPTMAIPAPLIGTETVRIGGADEPIRSVMLRLTQLFNITGHPAITLPCGVTTGGLPVGLQLVGRRHATSALLDVAAAVEPHVGPGESR